MKKFIQASFLAFVFSAGIAMAGDHDHGAGPNGGVVSEFGDFHAEGVTKGKTVGFYVLDADAVKVATVKKHQGGVLIIVPKKGKIKKKKIAPGANFKKIMVPVSSAVKMIKLKLKVNGKIWTAQAKL